MWILPNLKLLNLLIFPEIVWFNDDRRSRFSWER